MPLGCTVQVSLKWRLWTDLIDPVATAILPTASFKSITVPTADTMTMTFMLQKSLDNRTPLLLVGPTGTGKTVVVQVSVFARATFLYGNTYHVPYFRQNIY